MVLTSDHHGARLLLDAGTADLGYVPDAGGVVIETVFNPHDLPDEYRDASEEWYAGALADALPEGAEEFTVRDPMLDIVIAVEGGHDDLVAGFSYLLGRVAVTPGGDDETFLDWPSGARMALAMAADLDALHAGGWHDRSAATRRVIEGVLGELGEHAAQVRARMDPRNT
jgi:hypothetical protein